MNYLRGNIMKGVSVSEIQYEVSKDMDSRSDSQKGWGME